MRNVLALGAAVLFISSVGVAGAQERLPQSSSGSGFGVGTGVGDVSGNSGRTAAFDRTAFMERLAQAETVFGRVLANRYSRRQSFTWRRVAVRMMKAELAQVRCPL
jgi:hypothetical protein